MLVLTRKKSETLRLKCACGCQARVTVVDVRGQKVRLGVVADLDMEVSRDELDELPDELRSALKESRRRRLQTAQ